MIKQCEGRCVGLVANIVRDAVVNGDLVLREGMMAEEMIFGFWAINYGSQVLSATSPSLAAVGIVNAVKAIRHHCFTLFNGFEWQPTMSFASHVELMDRFFQQLDRQFENVAAPEFVR